MRISIKSNLSIVVHLNHLNSLIFTILFVVCKTSGGIQRSQNNSNSLSDIRPVTLDTYNFLVSIVKNNGVCQILVKERRQAQIGAIVKYWRKRRDGRGFTLGTFSVKQYQFEHIKRAIWKYQHWHLDIQKLTQFFTQFRQPLELPVRPIYYSNHVSFSKVANCKQRPVTLLEINEKDISQKISETLKRAILLNSRKEISVVESDFNKITRIDSRPATLLNRSFHQEKFFVDTSKFSTLLQKDLN